MSTESSDFIQPDQTQNLLSSDTASSTLMVAATGVGKAQPITEKVLTPTGWQDIGTIKIGDQVIGSKGTPVTVTGVFPQGMKPTMAVTFSDNSSVRCCREHLWSVQTKSQKSRGAGFCVKSTQELLGDLRDGSNAAKWYMPKFNGAKWKELDFKIDPYVVGAMLGDGGYKYGMQFSSADEFVVDELRSRLPLGYEVNHDVNHDYTIKTGVNRGFGIGSELRQELGRHGSATKSIPRHYLYGSHQQRLSLLRGLMDTDGTIGKSGRGCEFNTVSEQLACDVVTLARSLGGVTKIRNKGPSTYRHLGEKRNGLRSFRVSINTDDNPFLLPRKADRYEGARKVVTKSIDTITETGIEEECVCISVDADDSLYVTSGFNLTHNTVMMAGLAETWPLGRVMMLSHRFELNKQAQKTFEDFCSESVDFEQASFMADQCSVANRCRIVVASVQTLNAKRDGRRRMERFDPIDFGLLMIDEAHRAVSPSYRRVIQYFQNGNPDLRVVGVTATPDRLDGVGLGHVFETIACDYNIRWGIDEAWLVPLKQKIVVIDGLDFSSIRTKKNEVGEADLDQRQLAQIMEEEQFLHEMAGPILEQSGTRSCIVFCASVSHSERLSEVLNRHRPQCSISIDGSMPPMHPKRQELLARFKSGDIQFLCNCGIATEGFDAPIAEVIAIARPTKSRALYCQMAGRSTRPLPGVVDGIDEADDRRTAIATSPKPHATIIDFVGQAGRHSLVCTGDILAGENDPPEIVEAAKRLARKSDFDGDMIAALAKVKEEAEAREAARRARLTAKVNYTVEEVDVWSPMAWVPPRHVPGFSGDTPPSEKMTAALRKFGFTEQEAKQLNFKQAKAAISKCIERIEKGLCSLKQKRLLSKYGVDANRLTHAEASAKIDAIAKNGWKRPHGLS